MGSSRKSLFQPGQLVAGRYAVIDTIGAGGMGEVLRVADYALEKEVIALKVLYPQRARSYTNLARFKNEIVLARRLAHPNIVRLFDFGEAGQEMFYITMELIEGVGLTSRIHKSGADRLSFPEILRILYQLCAALHYAHQLKIIHRDLKPDNILLAADGTLKLTDFGIARSMDVEKGLTATGEMVGTPYYMAPEQFRGDKLDHRVDIYGLGILAYEMVTGERPFNHESHVALAAMHLAQALPQFPDTPAGIPRWFREFVETCTEKEADNRFQSTQEAAKVLYTHADELEQVPCSVGAGFCPLLRDKPSRRRGWLGSWLRST